MEEIYFKHEARDKLFAGITKLYEAVAFTMGPKGRTVIISDEYGNPKITKDGVSVARSINFKDPIENMGALLIKEVAERTVDQAGDGTTTATVLAQAFIQNLKEFDILQINKALDETMPKILQHLKDNSRELYRENIKHVASISANNDLQIGNVIQQAYNFSDIVKVEESNAFEDTLEHIIGMKLDVAYMSKRFANTVKETCELDSPYVLLLDGKLEDLMSLKHVLTKISTNEESLLIIVEHVSEKEMRKLESNVLSGNINLCVIKAPGFGPVRKDYLRDLSDFTGAEIVSVGPNKIVPITCLGLLKSCTITKSHSLLIKHESIDVDDIVENLMYLKNEQGVQLHEIAILDKRIENLTARASIIRVGGHSEIEMKERKDRYEDAVLAVASALEEGIVEGGGIALLKTYDNSNDDCDSIESKIYKSVGAPYMTIKFRNGADVDMEHSMFEQNIIDPLKVTRCALENAVSVARTILSTACVVLNERQWN